MDEADRTGFEVAAHSAEPVEPKASGAVGRDQTQDASGWAFFLGLGVVELAWLVLLVYVVYRFVR